MKARSLIVVLVVAASLAAGAWWFSPWWVLHQAKAAAERNDAQALSDVIDYPRLRESLKGEFNSALVGRLRDGASGLGEAGRTGAALGAVLASALVDKLVEVMVRPEFFIRAIRDGQFVLPGRSASERDRGAAPGAGAGGDAQGGGTSRSGSGTQRGGAAPGPSTAPGGASAPGTAQGGGPPEPARFKWRPERASSDRMIVWVSRADPAAPASAAPSSEFGLVFERRGWLDWKLCAVRLPPGLAGGR
jgi:hypothetical protein